MRGAINRFVVRIIDPLDNVSLLAHSGVWKNRIGSGEIFQVRFERTDVDGRAVRNVLGNAKRVGGFMNTIKTRELPTARANGVGRVDQTIGARTNPAVSSIRISRRPTPRAVYFTGANWTVANRRARQ